MLSLHSHCTRPRSDLRTNQLGAAVVTQILPVSEFYPAEEYHRQYYKKEPYHYQRYHDGCGRNWRLKELWGRETE